MCVALVIQQVERMRRIYCRLWPVWICNIFPHLSQKGTIFETKHVLGHKARVLISSITFVRNTSHSKKNSARYRGADKSLARPGRKQATATEEFDVHISYL